MARSSEELLLVAQELGDLSENELVERAAGDGRAWVRELAGHGSLVSVTFGSEARYVVSEERTNYEERGDTALRDILLRYLSARGPASAADLANRYDVPADRVATVLEDLRLEALVVAGAFGEPGVRNFAGMRLAERIRRKTLTILRREIQPVPLTAFRAFLLKRQGVETGSRFAGAGAAERALALLRALPLPVLAWERGLLAARLAEPEPDAFDVLSARGLLCWRLEGVKDPRAARLSVFYRGEGRFALPPLPPALDGLSKDARRVYDALAVRGALFAPDLAADTGLESPSLAKALQELALQSLVTADGFHGLRQMLRKGRRGAAPEPATKPISAFARPTRAELKAAESRVAQRSGFSPYGPPETPEGRWSLLHAPGVLGPEVREDHRAEGWARLLLARWGVVFRDLVVEHEGDIRWSDLAPALARLELRGDVRRGEFLEGAGPMQFAEPEVVELLRAAREEAPGEDPVISVVCGADPVLFGLEARPDDWFAFANGALLFRLTGDGALTPEASASGRSLKAGLAAAKDLLFRVRDPLGKPRVLTVASIAGDPVLSTPYVPILEGLGFTRDAGRLSYRAL
ncbi:MAG: hypothetical protein JNK60_08365 [Acidobacteria bacterium]|nr:hypothetical protein [Acidobacteriota bacterium]